MGRLVITADDYGYAPAYDRGILEAARAGAVDAVSSFAGGPRPVEPGPLVGTGIEIGLHLDLPQDVAELPAAAAGAFVERQLEEFERVYSRPPGFLNGHLHCHADGDVAAEVARLAAQRDLPVRSVGTEHRARLRAHGVVTQDRLIGRLREDEPPVPAEIDALRADRGLPPGVTEWMVHPGRPDPATGSSYDRGRGEDLRLLLQLADDPHVRTARLDY